MDKIILELWTVCNMDVIFVQVAAISEQASEITGDPSSEKFSSSSIWKLFDMHAVVDSTEDLLLFILSDKGLRVRLFLLRDIIEAADVFLQNEVIDCALDENPQGQRTLLFEVFSYVKYIQSVLSWASRQPTWPTLYCQSSLFFLELHTKYVVRSFLPIDF